MTDSNVLICYAGVDYQAAVSFFGASVGRTIEVLWSEASEENDLQVCLNQMIPQILTSREPQSSLTYYDTHGMLSNCGILSATL